MFEVDIEMLKEQGLQIMDTAKKTALDIADKGKNQLELLNQQARLSKAQRQLGALVYSLHKAGEENQPLVDKYIEAIAEIESTIEAIKARMTPAERAEAEAEADAEEEETVEEQPAAEEEAAEDEEIIEEEPDRPRGETKVCPVCHSEVDAEALFCNHCGAQL
ncbi:MAG TPA: zinc ribbon domain-containing protein [Candidatus Gemmiger faecigallinarum]|nr:zinc ribbon domain-containing protein [Candidatus Gemmiger faecigallinarum]